MHGWQAAAGVILLTACVAFYAGAVLPLERQLDRNAHEIPGAGPQSGAQREISEAELRRALARFYARFQGRRALQEQLTAIQAAARTAGISLKRAEYRLVGDGTMPLKQYRVVIPVTDAYPRIRQFVSTVLADVPAASLDTLNLQRRRVADVTVEAEIQMTLFFMDQG
jgi:hypothetical protein